MATIRVTCSACHARLDVLDGPPLARSRAWAGPADSVRARGGRRYRCRCGADHVVRVERLRAAYDSAAGAGRRVVELPLTD